MDKQNTQTIRSMLLKYTKPLVRFSGMNAQTIAELMIEAIEPKQVQDANCEIVQALKDALNLIEKLDPENTEAKEFNRLEIILGEFDGVDNGN